MTAKAAQSKDATLGVAAVAMAAFIFGASALFSALDASPVWISAGRGVFAALALAVVAAVAGLSLRVPWREFRAACVMAALLAAHWVAFFASAQIGGVAICTLSVSTFPLFTVAIEAVQRRRAPDGASLAAAAVIVAAIGLVAHMTPRPAADAALGTAIGLCAALLFAVFALMSQRAVKAIGPFRLAFYQYGLAALFLAPALPFTAPIQGGQAWIAIIVLGIVGTAIAHQLYLFALARLPAAFCGAVVSLEPIFAVLLAAMIFSEPADWTVFVAAALIIGASRVLMRPAASS